MSSPEDQPMKRRKTFPAPNDLPKGVPSLWRPPGQVKVEDPPKATSSAVVVFDAGLPPENEHITFISANGKKYQWPFDLCQDWEGMKRLIDYAHSGDYGDSRIVDGHFELYNSGGYIVLKEVWEKVVKPGEVVTMKLLPQRQYQLLAPPSPSCSMPQAVSSPGAQSSLSHSHERPQVPSRETLSPAPQSQALVSFDLLGPLIDDFGELSSPALQPLVLWSESLGELNEPGALIIHEPKLHPISFKVGNKVYSCPFRDCKTWEGMERFMKGACGFGQAWGSLDQHLEIGAYDLLRHQGEGESHVVLPSVWESLVEPGWIVEMLPLPLPPQFGPAHEPEPEQTTLADDIEPPPLETAPPEEGDMYLPSDAQKVELEARREGGTTFYYFLSTLNMGKKYKTEAPDWAVRKINHRGRDRDCFLYTGKKTGSHFWTWSLPRSSKRKHGY